MSSIVDQVFVGIPLASMSIMEAVISTQAAVPEITPMPSSDVHDPTHTSEPAASNRGPIPMSFPAVLRTAGLTDRYAHLRVPSAVGLSPPARSRMPKRDENEGKRWIRRRENGRFHNFLSSSSSDETCSIDHISIT